MQHPSCGNCRYKNILIPAMDLWEVLLPKGMHATFHEDNTAMIRVVETGRNPTMKHLNRVHGVGIAFLHEILTLPETNDPVTFKYEESANMSADIYTKAFTDTEKWTNVRKLINIYDNTALQRMQQQQRSRPTSTPCRLQHTYTHPQPFSEPGAGCNQHPIAPI